MKMIHHSRLSIQQESNLIKTYTPLVTFLAGTFYSYNTDDCKQAGYVGLLKAIRNHDNKKPFVTFAWYCIRREILNYIREEKKHQCKRLNSDFGEYSPTGIWEYFPTLSSIEEQIINLRCQGYTFTEISKRLNIFSRYWISQKYKGIIKKIREANEILL